MGKLKAVAAHDDVFNYSSSPIPQHKGKGGMVAIRTGIEKVQRKCGLSQIRLVRSKRQVHLVACTTK